MYSYEYPRPALTADCIVFAHADDGIRVLLVERGNEPYKGCWAFPGGFMNMDETTAEAARRELREETGLDVGAIRQLGAYDRVDRDPRGRVITVAYIAIVDDAGDVCGGDDAHDARWFRLDSLPTLAFDHDKILADACRMVINPSTGQLKSMG